METNKKRIEKFLNKNKEKESGFFDLPNTNRCMHPEHNPPTGICIPQGKGYRHVCPACGKVQIVIPPQYTL
jgi:hypothetical protein